MSSSFRTCELWLFLFLTFILFKIYRFLNFYLYNVTQWEYPSNPLLPTPCLKCCSFRILSATDFIPTLKRSQNIQLLHLYSAFWYILEFLTHQRLSVGKCSGRCRLYNGCLWDGLFRARECDIITYGTFPLHGRPRPRSVRLGTAWP